MVTKDELIISTAQMLDSRYDEEHNVTIQAVIERHLKKEFLLRKYICKKTAKSMGYFFWDKGIFQPHRVKKGRVITTWKINIPELKAFLKEAEEYNSLVLGESESEKKNELKKYFSESMTIPAYGRPVEEETDA